MNPAETWAEVYWEPVAVVPNSDLFLFFESTEKEIVVPGVIGADVYELGLFYQSFTAHPLADLAFKTYTDDEFVVPIPGVF